MDQSETSSTTSSYSRYENNKNLTKRLQNIVQTNCGYQFIQQNGQRVYEPCPYLNMIAPPKGCEIFIGNIPKHIFEDRLIPLFQTVGKLYKFRLMLDFTQRTRGYAFATYFNPQHAQAAIDNFHGYAILKDAILGVYKSIDNRRLFVGNLPKSKTRDEVYNVFNNFVKGLVDVIIYSNWKDIHSNRGFAFLEFESHMDASVARRQLHPRNLVIWDQAIYVDWADPVPEVCPLIMAQVTVLYVKNLPFEMDSRVAHAFFQSIAGASLIKKTHKIYTYAFVHCKNRHSAEILMKRLTGFILEGTKLEIEWARPREYSSYRRSLQPPENFCLSVPLRTRKLVRQLTESRRNSSFNNSETASNLTISSIPECDSNE